MEISNLSDIEFKTLVTRMLKELGKELNSIKKIQSEISASIQLVDALIEIKNNLQGNNSIVNKVDNQINDLEYKEAKKQPIRTTRRKRNPKKQG